jgi:hypothetical protein
MTRPAADPGFGPEAGSSLVAAVVLGMAIATATVGLVVATEQARATSERERDRSLALAAAEAGIAEATARLIADPEFASAAASGADLGDPALRRWVGLEGGTAYRYGIVVSHGVVTVRARGRAGPIERAVEVDLRPRGLADVHRLVDVEVTDPHVVPGTVVAACDRPLWADPPRSSDCPHAVYAGPEVVAGSLHTNDVLLVSGAPHFESSVSTAWLGDDEEPGAATLWRAVGEDAGPTFRRSPRHHGRIDLPASIGALDLPDDGVCHYHGPTLLRFAGTELRVWSPGSLDPAPGAPSTSTACGGGALGGRVTVAHPPSGVVRIHPGRGGCSAHPLGLDPVEEHDGGYGCASGDAFVWGHYEGRLSVVADGDVHLVWDVGPVDVGLTSTDVLGVIAGGSVIVRRPVSRPVRGSAPYGRNLVFAGPGIPPFGDHPLDAPTAVPTSWVAPAIEAHLVALGRSIRIQNPSRGQRNSGTLTVTGSLAQRYRGPFELPIPGSTVVSGYPSVLAPRAAPLRAAPPGFPTLGDGTWVQVGWRETDPGAP